MKQSFYGWKLLAALWVIIAFGLGFASYGGSLLNTYMIAEMHLDRKSLGLASGSFALCMGLFSPVTGFCVHRWGARAVLTAGTLLVTLGALAMATIVNTLIGAMIAYGLVMGCAAALGGTIPAQTVTSYWFRKRLALALALLFSGSNIGGFIATPLLAKVIVAYDGNWRMGWFVVSAVCAVAFLCAILFVRNKPADIGQVQDGVKDEDSQLEVRAGTQPAPGVYKTTVDWTYREAVRHPTFWMMIFGVACATSALGMMVGHGVAHCKDLGHSPGMAAMFLSMVIVTGLAGKAIFALLGDRIEPRFLWSAALIACAIGLALVVKATSELELYVAGFLLGAGPAVCLMSMFTLAVNYYGKTSYPSLMGVTGLFLAVVPSIVGVLTGIVFDQFGSYALAFYSAAAICVLTSLMLLFAGPPKRALSALETC